MAGNEFMGLGTMQTAPWRKGIWNEQWHEVSHR